MTQEEQKSHFSMWCMIASALILGNDLHTISKETLDILLNKESIAINQDALGKQGN
jgi:alpha-galactosidase